MTDCDQVPLTEEIKARIEALEADVQELREIALFRVVIEGMAK